MSRRFNIVVVGGGVTGLMAATLLAKSEHRDRLAITLVDAASRPILVPNDVIDVRVSAIATGSAALFEQVNAWDFVTGTRVSPYERMRVWDEGELPEGPATLRFDADEFAVPQLGFIVENVLLQQALLQQLDASEVELRFDSPLQALRRVDEQYKVDLQTDDTLTADLVVAADGARSFVRSAAGIEAQEWPYEQTAFVTHLQPEKPHRATAWQRFLRDGPIGILPLADGRVSVVWSTTPAMAEEALESDEATTGRLLTAATDAVLGELTVAGPRAAFPLCARHASNYVLPNLALIGDAAHAIHPLAGQGANLGLQDAAELVKQLCNALSTGLHPGDRPVLRRYERARKGANATMLHFMTGLNRLFATDSRLVAELRAAGMRLFNRSGPIRKRAVEVALGV